MDAFTSKKEPEKSVDVIELAAFRRRSDNMFRKRKCIRIPGSRETALDFSLAQVFDDNFDMDDTLIALFKRRIHKVRDLNGRSIDSVAPNDPELRAFFIERLKTFAGMQLT